MKIALEPYVVEFLRYRGYRYFRSKTIACQNGAAVAILNPRFVKPEENEPDAGLYIEISAKQPYVVTNQGQQEWMWASIPNYEIVNLRRWQVKYFTRGLIFN
jgi:hypothetical protein